MDTQQRQQLLSTLAKSSLKDIKHHWDSNLDDYSFISMREPQTGMVMAVARTEASGEPFNLGEVTVTRCALQLESGETGIGYVMGSDKQHAMHVALLDALAQRANNFEQIYLRVISPLQQKIKHKIKQQQQKTATTKVDFLNMVRGED